MSQGKGSRQRPSAIPQTEWSRRYHETFEQHERRISADPKEHARRLARKQRLILRETVFPDQTSDDR